MSKTFAERCHIAQQFLPDAQYKAMLTALHTEMLAKLAEQPAQQKPEWVGLTDEEMSDTVADMDVDFGDLLWKVVCLTKIIEAKLRSKNHD